MTEKELQHVDSIVNLSGFKDELAENGIEFINIRNREVCPPFFSFFFSNFFLQFIFSVQEAALYTVAIVKNGYMLPHTNLDDFTPEVFTDPFSLLFLLSYPFS